MEKYIVAYNKETKEYFTNEAGEYDQHRPWLSELRFACFFLEKNKQSILENIDYLNFHSPKVDVRDIVFYKVTLTIDKTKEV